MSLVQPNEGRAGFSAARWVPLDTLAKASNLRKDQAPAILFPLALLESLSFQVLSLEHVPQRGIFDLIRLKNDRYF